MGKLPIEKNYGGRMEELPFEELFLLKKPFYKNAAKYLAPTLAGMTMFAGVPNWDAPKHTPKQNVKQPGIVYAQKDSPKGIADFLKAAEAWAEDGVNVYIEDFGCNSMINADFPDLGKSIANNLRMELRKMRINVKRTYNPNTDILISGQADVVGDAAKGTYIILKMGYEMNGNDTMGIGIDTELPMNYYPYVKDIANMVYTDVITLGNSRSVRKERQNQIIENMDRWKEVELGPNAKKMLEDPKFRPLVIKSFESDGYKVEGNHVFKPIQK